MENFICTDTDLLNLDSGTHELPLLIKIEKGKTIGYVFITKISTMFYKALRSNKVTQSGSVSLRCSNSRTVCT